MLSGVLEIVMERRSVRRYLSDPVPSDAVERVLEAARWAPSAHNTQPWRFVVLREQDAKRGLAETMARAWEKDLQDDGVPRDMREDLAQTSVERFTSAPIVIIGCMTMEEMDEYPDERRREAERAMAVQSTAAAIQNLLLAAHDEGLGACWFCAPLFCPDAVRRALGIPIEVEPQVLITVGKPAEEPKPPPRKALENIVHYDRW